MSLRHQRTFINRSTYVGVLIVVVSVCGCRVKFRQHVMVPQKASTEIDGVLIRMSLRPSPQDTKRYEWGRPWRIYLTSDGSDESTSLIVSKVDVFSSEVEKPIWSKKDQIALKYVTTGDSKKWLSSEVGKIDVPIAEGDIITVKLTGEVRESGRTLSFEFPATFKSLIKAGESVVNPIIDD